MHGPRHCVFFAGRGLFFLTITVREYDGVIHRQNHLKDSCHGNRHIGDALHEDTAAHIDYHGDKHGRQEQEHFHERLAHDQQDDEDQYGSQDNHGYDVRRHVLVKVELHPHCVAPMLFYRSFCGTHVRPGDRKVLEHGIIARFAAVHKGHAGRKAGKFFFGPGCIIQTLEHNIQHVVLQVESGEFPFHTVKPLLYRRVVGKEIGNLVDYVEFWKIRTANDGKDHRQGEENSAPLYQKFGETHKSFKFSISLAISEIKTYL